MTTSPESKWTKGPWSIGRSADNTPLVMVPTPLSEGSGFGVACVNRIPRMGSVRGDMNANAHLIASAPDMASFVKKHADAGDVEAQALWRTINGAS